MQGVEQINKAEVWLSRRDKLEQWRNNLNKVSAFMYLLLHMILADVKLTETTSSDHLQGAFKIPASDEGVTSTSQC